MRKNLFVALLIMAALAFNAAAMSPSEEKDLTSRTMSILGGSGAIYASDVKLGLDNSLDITIVPMAPNSNEDAEFDKNMLSAVASTIGLYLGTANKYPEITDLHLAVAGDNWVPVATLYCKHSWIDQVRTNPDGTYNQDDMASLLLKALGTSVMQS